MKKTLIALAVMASSATSCSVMAWTGSGNGGTVTLGGTLNVVNVVSPWEVKTGSAVNNLDADIKKGNIQTVVKVTKAIPILGIRIKDGDLFKGQKSISPQINYNGAVDLKGTMNSRSGLMSLFLKIHDKNGNTIGTLQTSILGGAGISRKVSGDAYSAYPDTSVTNYAFKGGIPTGTATVAYLNDLKSRINKIDSTFTQNFNDHGVTNVREWKSVDFSNQKESYSAFYGSGIEAGQTINITLNGPHLMNETFNWTASLPVTVYYM